jgi:hypothetical protein
VIVPPGTTDPGTTDPGTTDPGTTDPGTTDPGTTDPGTTDPGTTDPGTTDPGTTDPGTIEPTGTPCSITSNYPGDELCILPPNAGEGIQLHVGPTDYDDPAAVAAYLVAPGEENVRCFAAPVTEGGYYIRQQNRMRPGSHHMLINLETGGTVTGASCDIGSSVGSVPGSQTPSRDFPSELGPEDAGLARFVPPEATAAAFQLHYVNSGDTTLLREAWVNLYWMPESEVAQRLQGIFLVGDLSANIPAYTRQTTTLQFTPQLTSSTRVFAMNGHSHAHTESFTVWRVRGTESELIYQSFDWAEPDELTFNTVVQNPAPDPVALTDGGVSGLLYLEPGDTLRWACDVNNTTDQALRFANEAYTAEMCLLAGAYISDTAGLMRGGCAGGSCFGGLF